MLCPVKQDVAFLECFFKKNGPIPVSFIVYFRSFQTNIITILQQIYVEKCTSSIRCQDSNPRPLELESPPIITRPWLPPEHFKAFRNYSRISFSLIIILTSPRWHFCFVCFKWIWRPEQQRNLTAEKRVRTFPDWRRPKGKKSDLQNFVCRKVDRNAIRRG